MKVNVHVYYVSSVLILPLFVRYFDEILELFRLFVFYFIAEKQIYIS
jgi:hypothetical protein